MAKKRSPNCLKALGRQDMPAAFDLNGSHYDHVCTFKHDFFAATGMYASGENQVVLKIGRRVSFLGMPLAWVGRMLAHHEADQMSRLIGLPGVPAVVGVWEAHGLVHEFIPGHTLEKGEMVPDIFFDELRTLLAAMHAQGIAYVDLEKPQNVLVGEDGKPYLIDFQISWPWPVGKWGQLLLGRVLGKRLIQGDRYHVQKLQRRVRPDQMSESEIKESYRRPWPVRLHQRVIRPGALLRRWVLAKVDPKRKVGERGRVDEETLGGVIR